MDWTSILQVVVTLAIVVVVGLCIPWFREKLGSARFDTLMKWANVIALAVEQVFTTPKSGAEKKSQAMDFLDGLFGNKYSEGEKSAAIEAVVKEMNDEKKEE